MTAAHRRHDITDQVWERLQPHLPGGPGKRGRPARDNRLFLDAVFWNLRTGAPLAGPTARLRGLEEHPSPLLSLAGPGRLG